MAPLSWLPAAEAANVAALARIQILPGTGSAAMSIAPHFRTDGVDSCREIDQFVMSVVARTMVPQSAHDILLG